MEQFNIIQALNDAATANGWKFGFAIDDRNQDFNIAACKHFTPDEIILLVGVRMTPTFSGAKISERSFTTLLMLGRKFESAGTVSSLDETSLQKYNRRLFELQGLLETFIGDFSCNNDLDIVPAEFTYAKNLFDTNIDFVMTSNLRFIQ